MSQSLPDLTKCSGGDLAKVMADATRLGISDETAGRPARTEREIVTNFASGWRKGHAQALKAAYTAGRFHVRTMGLDD
jgi:hypothetical protein